MNINDRLRRLRKDNKLLQADVAKAIGIARPTYVGYEKGTIIPPANKLSLLAKYFNVSVDYLIGGKLINNVYERNRLVQDQNINFITSTQTRKINVLGSIPAGTPIEAIEDVIDTIDIPTSWRGDYIALRVQGDSMYPEYLDGDIIIIQIQPDCDSGDDCACYVNGYDATFKRVYKNNGSITLQPLNPKYPPKTYTHPGEVSILGKVIELRRSK